MTHKRDRTLFTSGLAHVEGVRVDIVVQDDVVDAVISAIENARITE